MTRAWQLPEEALVLGQETWLMGILNTTPDSFSDGGCYLEPEAAIAQGKALAAAGAAVIDVGGESTRPGSADVSIQEEARRTTKVIRALHQAGLRVSIDSYKAEVVETALEAGAVIINDIYALQADPRMARLAAESKAGLILMNHPVWYRPQHPASQVFPKREAVAAPSQRLLEALAPLDALEACQRFLSHAIETALKAGVQDAAIMLDPGLGFGLTTEENLLLCRQISVLKAMGFPVLVAASRKRFIRAILGEQDAAQEEGTAAVGVAAVAQGADMLRVHDVAGQRPFIRMADAIYR